VVSASRSLALRGRLFWGCLLGALLLAPRPAESQPLPGRGPEGVGEPATGPTAEGELPVVSFVVIGDGSTFDAMARITDSRALDRFDVRLQRRDTLDIVEILAEGRTKGVAIHCFVDLRRPEDVRVYFADRGTERFLYRRLALASRDGTLDWETLSQVVELSLLALYENKDLGLTRAEIEGLLAVRRPTPHPPAPALPEPEAPNHAPHRWGLAVVTHYRVRSHSDEVRAVHGPDLGVTVERQGPRSTWGFGAEAALGFEQSYQEDRAGVEMAGLASLLTLDFGHRVSQKGEAVALALGARLGLGLEFVHLRPRPGDGQHAIELTESRFIHLPIATLAVVGKLDLTPQLAFELVAGSLFDLGRVHFDVEMESERAVVLERYRVQPMVAVGFGFR